MTADSNDESGVSIDKFIGPEMRRLLPAWVLTEYYDYLSDLYESEGYVPDDADMTTEERREFYERLLCNPSLTGVWDTFEERRHLWNEHHWDGGGDGSVPETDLVRHILISVHMSFRRYTPLEALRRKERDDLGNDIASLAKKLRTKLAYLWSLSAPEEREYPAQFVGIDHDEAQELLGKLAESSSRWVETQPVLLRPGRGNAARRFFIIEMATYFEEMFTATDELGEVVESHRFDNVLTALSNALFPEDGGLDQPGVSSVLNIVKRAKTVP